MKVTRLAKIAIALGAAASVAAAGLMVPSNAATRSTVVLVQSNSLTSLNPSVVSQNLTANVDVAYMTSMGFNYYNNKPALVANTVFGSYKIVKNTAKDFRTEWRINKGLVWSDGTPITADDLLLSHVLCSSKYSKAAGLGDPSDENTPPAFNASCYGGLYDNNLVGNPKVSSDNLAVTLRWPYPIPDWDLYGPGVFPVHTLSLMADGKKKIGTAAENLAAKKKFRAAFDKKNTAQLKKMGAIWSTDYNIKTVNKSTNPLLLVNNGAYLVKSAVADQSVTLALNPRYNSGPKTNGVKTIVVRTIGDGTAAAQALANKEIDIYAGQPTADAVAQLKSFSGVKVLGGNGAVYEHVDIRTNSAEGVSTPYTGLFAYTGNAAADAKAKDLRTAFLLSIPRQEIVDRLIKPINSKAVVMNSVTTFPSEPAYKEITSKSGVAKYVQGTQAQRTAQALQLVQKHFPNTSAANPTVEVKLLWGTPTNQRRASQAQLIIAEAAKAGFKVIAPGDSAWPTKLGLPDHDASFFAWVKSSTSQLSPQATFQSDGSNNYSGFYGGPKNAAMDKLTKSLEKAQSPAKLTKTFTEMEKILMDEAITIAIFQHPNVTAHNSALKNVKPSPLSPQLVWNFWEWKY
jgi:peptide/nickel transport system substrate-binding protein